MSCSALSYDRQTPPDNHLQPSQSIGEKEEGGKEGDTREGRREALPKLSSLHIKEGAYENEQNINGTGTSATSHPKCELCLEVLLKIV